MRVTLTEPGIVGNYDVVEHEERLVLEKNLEPSADELHGSEDVPISVELRRRS